jgi:hypothetical protein
LDLRERVIAGLAILAGLRPGEIFALRRCHVEQGYANIRQRIYQGVIDTPKTFNSVRWAATGDGLAVWLAQWLDPCPKRQLLEAFFSAAPETGRPRMGELPSHAKNARHLARRPRYRSAGARRSNGAHRRCESEPVHAVFFRAAEDRCEFA